MIAPVARGVAFAALAVLAAASLPAQDRAAADHDALSPTGRAPRLVWTPERQQVWHRMRATGQPLYRLAGQNCAQAMRGSPRYADRGLWCAWIYQVDGDPRAGRMAWRQIRGGMLNGPANANDVRENMIETAILFDWLVPVLSAAERDSAVAGLNRWAEYALGINTKKYQGGLLLSDSDALVGYFFGLAAIDIATRGLPGHRPWLEASPQTAATTVTVGGLSASGADWSTARNALHRYLTGPGAGGEWIEGSGYNVGTIGLMAMGYAAVARQAPDGALEDVAAFLEAAGLAQRWEVTPDLQQPLQWGDEEHPRDLRGRLFKRTTTLSLLAGVNGDTPGGRAAQGFLQSLYRAFGTTGYRSAEPWARALLTWNPWLPGDDPANAPAWRYNEGSGHLLVRQGADQVSILMPPRTGAHHEVQFLATMQVYRRGEWALTQPLGYAGASLQGDGANGGLVAGMSSMAQKGAEQMQHGDDWWALTGSTGGPKYVGNYYQPPPAFLEYWRRTVVYFRRDGVDHLVTIDRLAMDDPASLPRLDRYRAPDRAAIRNAPGLFQWVVHAPVPPDTTGGMLRWTTPGGQPVVVQHGSGPSEQVIIHDERKLYTTYHVQPPERKWQARLVPAFTGGSMRSVHVISIGAEQPPPVHAAGDQVRVGGTTITIGDRGVAVEG